MAAKKKRKTNPLLEHVEITGVAAEGKAMARVNDKVLFVPFAAPGDVVDVQVKKSGKNYMEGEVRMVHRLSSLRVQPFCIHFGSCGGCKWQHLPYANQLEFKQQQVLDSLQRIAKVDTGMVEFLPIAGSDKTIFYRNKLEFTFSNRRWLSKEEIGSDQRISRLEGLGFHIPGLFDKVLDIEKCWLQPEPSNEIRLVIKAFAVEHNMSFYDLRANKGLLRNLIVRNTRKGDVMVLMVFGEDNSKAINMLMQFIDCHFTDLHSLVYVVNQKQNSSIADLEPVVYKGSPFLEEYMEDLSFQIGPKSFYQTNPEQACRLYSIVRDFAGLSGQEVVYDIYSGTGSIACFLAARARRVVGIEYVNEAVDHARTNASLNAIENAIFLSGDMAGVFTTGLMEQYGHPDVIVTDPPRAGMHPKVVKQIMESGAGRIVYVSCNPATQARDIELLGSRYRVVKSQAVDMFPHTHHVENVILLERKRPSSE